MKIINLLLFSFCWILLPAPSYAQTADDDQPYISTTRIEGPRPSSTAFITRYYLDKTVPPSDYATGNLHIIYSDGTKVQVKVDPKEISTPDNTVFNEEGLSDVKLAKDKRTIGWTELIDNCCTSYPVPQVLAIYQSGETIMRIREGSMVWYWTFRDKGQQVAAVWGPTHGPEVGDYQLYDVKAGRMLTEVYGDEPTQSLNPYAPEWARQTEQEMHKQK